MMKMLKFLIRHKYSIITLGLGAVYFWFIVFSHNVGFGDYKDFVKHPVELFYGFTRWTDWSSRLLIESSANLFSKSLFGWKLVTVITGAVLFWSIGRILGNRRIWQSILLFSIVLLTNWNMLSTAGIFATTVNYLWPMACFAFVVAVIAKPFQNRKLNIASKTIMIPLFVFAMCSEQLAVFALILSIAYIAEKLYKKEKFPTIIWILFGIALLGVINVIVAPGNAVRQVSEVNYWWPGFDHLPIKQKIVNGIMVTFSRLLFAPEILAVVLIFALLILAYVKRNLKAFIVMVPTAILTLLAFFPATVGAPGTSVRQGNYFNELREFALFLTPTSFPSPDQKRVYFMIFAAFTVGVVLAILYLYRKTRKTYMMLLFLGAGLIVSLAVSFSPTVLASNTRTLYPMVIVLTGIDFIIIKDLLKDRFKEAKDK